MTLRWFQNKFKVLLANASEATVQIYARGYIIMLLPTTLFADKSGARVHLWWLLYVADLDGLGKYSWSSATLSWLYRCLCRIANRNVKNLAGPLALLQFLPSSDEKGPRVIVTRHRLDRLSRDDISLIFI
ncbi:hypothetical protein Ahy_A09g041428 isoform A [Arachis hypogaea]|uniref:Aminotransferase-like plant mobile domain-containing protein n=1 Tax=Arachis hypogaea TaxID=3818 RepID=A0A445BCQ6_ARAHY|nr:hypothetical protein Ahy_A09g041428 isoform A [Arachis hypogaea]